MQHYALYPPLYSVLFSTRTTVIYWSHVSRGGIWVDSLPLPDHTWPDLSTDGQSLITDNSPPSIAIHSTLHQLFQPNTPALKLPQLYVIGSYMILLLP